MTIFTSMCSQLLLNSPHRANGTALLAESNLPLGITIQSFVIFIFDFIPFSTFPFYCSIVSIERIDDAIHSFVRISANELVLRTLTHTLLISYAVSLFVRVFMYVCMMGTTHLQCWWKWNWCACLKHTRTHTHTRTCHTKYEPAQTKTAKETSESDNKVWFDYLIVLLENFLCILLHQLTHGVSFTLLTHIHVY